MDTFAGREKTDDLVTVPVVEVMVGDCSEVQTALVIKVEVEVEVAAEAMILLASA